MAVDHPQQISVERTCRYGHGQLDSIDGIWSLEGLRPQKSAVGGLASNGQVFTVRVFRCETCGYVELYDDMEVYGERD